jgi:hypothetical protein
MAVPFTKLTTRKWAILTSKIGQLFIVIGIMILMAENEDKKIPNISLVFYRVI